MRSKMANDANNTAQELFKLLMNAASSRRGSSADKKPRVVISKEEREYQKQLKKRTEAYKADDAARRANTLREKVVGKQYDGLIKKINSFGTSIEDAAKNARNLKELEKIPETVSKALATSSSAFVRQMSNQAKTLEGVFKVENIAKARQELIQYLSTMAGKNKMSAGEYDLLEQRVKAAGTTFDKLGIKVRSWQRGEEKLGASVDYTGMSVANLSRETNELSTALGNASNLVENKFNKTLVGYADYWKQQLVKLGTWANLWAAVQSYRTDFEKQRQYSATDVSTIDSARLGVSLGQLTDQVIDSRMTLLAMENGGKDAMGELRKSISAFRDISSSPEQALKDLLGVQKNISKFGVTQQNLTDEVEKQVAIYKSSFAPMGYSMEQFNELTSQIVNDIDTRKQLAGLQQKERKAATEALQARYAEIQAIYGSERAMEVFRNEQERANMGPMERLKQSNYAQGAFASLGLSRQGAEYRQLMLKLPSATGEQKEQMQKRITEIESEVSNAYQKALTEPGQARALMAEAAFQKVGMDVNKLMTANTVGSEGQQIGKPAPREMSKTEGFVSDILSGVHQIENVLDSSTIKLAASAVSLGALLIVGNKTNSLLQQIRDSIKGNISGGTPGAPGKTGKLGKLGKLAKIGKWGGIAATLGFAGYEAYDAMANSESNKEKTEKLGGAAGTVAGGAVGSRVGTWAGMETGGLLGGAVGGPPGALIGAVIGGGLGWWAGGAGGATLGNMAGQHIGGYISNEAQQPTAITPPSMQSDSELLRANAAKELELQELIKLQKQQVEYFKSLEEHQTLSHEASEQLQKLIQKNIDTMKAGFNSNKEAVDKQTDYVKKNAKRITMPIVSGSSLGNGKTQ